MQVTATAKGYMHGRIILPGETFSIADDAAFSSEWMAKPGATVAEDKPAKKRGKKTIDISTETTMEIDVSDDEAIKLARELTGRDDLEDAAEAREILEAAGGVE